MNDSAKMAKYQSHYRIQVLVSGRKIDEGKIGWKKKLRPRGEDLQFLWAVGGFGEPSALL